MSNPQRTVCAIGAATMVLAVMFFVPWRLHSTNEIEWGALFRQPMSYAQSYATDEPGARIYTQDADIHTSYLLIEILAIGAVSLAGYLLAGRVSEDGSP
jgi:hypothetical protein